MNTESEKQIPIFIHSLFRAGSTYLFQVFRRSDAGYWVYQEPMHETTFASANNPGALLNGFGEAETKLNRHPRLNGSYFQELFDAWPAWKDSIAESMVYRAYFASKETEVGTVFWQSLIAAAKGRPVFQECRTSGRIQAIKNALGGRHLYLWRNPWDQWWSYKINNYFNTANQLIIHADDAPAPLQLMRRALDLPQYDNQDLGGAFAFYSQRLLTSEQSYLVFYMLWCLALLEGAKNAHLMINIDRLSESADYRNEMLDKLRDLEIDGIDFSDCQVPQGFYSKDQQTFFATAESRVHLWLIEGGWQHSDLEVIKGLRKKYQPKLWSTPYKTIKASILLEQADRLQEMARRFETSAAEHAETLIDTQEVVQQLEIKVHDADRRAFEADERVNQSQSQLNQALLLVEQAQQLSRAAEERTQKAEERIQQVEVIATNQRQLAEQRLLQIEELYRSTSWRITAPLRWPAHQMRLLKQYGLKNRLKALLRKVLRKINKLLLDSPKLRNLLVRLSKSLGLYNALKKLQKNLRESSASHGSAFRQGDAGKINIDDQNIEQLSSRARQIYKELLQTIERKKAEGN